MPTSIRSILDEKLKIASTGSKGNHLSLSEHELAH